MAEPPPYNAVVDEKPPITDAHVQPTAPSSSYPPQQQPHPMAPYPQNPQPTPYPPANQNQGYPPPTYPNTPASFPPPSSGPPVSAPPPSSGTTGATVFPTTVVSAPPSGYSTTGYGYGYGYGSPQARQRGSLIFMGIAFGIFCCFFCVIVIMSIAIPVGISSSVNSR